MNRFKIISIIVNNYKIRNTWLSKQNEEFELKTIYCLNLNRLVVFHISIHYITTYYFISEKLSINTNMKKP